MAVHERPSAVRRGSDWAARHLAWSPSTSAELNTVGPRPMLVALARAPRRSDKANKRGCAAPGPATVADGVERRHEVGGCVFSDRCRRPMARRFDAYPPLASEARAAAADGLNRIASPSRTHAVRFRSNSDPARSVCF